MFDFRKNKNINFGLFFIVASYAYIFFVTLNYESAWMLPEIFRIKYAIIAEMHYETGCFWPFKYIFRFDEFEFAHRSTRLLSSLFEIGDSFFRGQLWKLITPHPSLSLTFIFTLLLTPYCLYKLMRTWNLSDNQAKIAVSFYLTQPGTLSLLAMYFRPAKSLSIFCMMLSFLLAATIEKRLLSEGKPVRLMTVALFLSLVAGFLFDETAAIFYCAFFVVFYEWVCRSKKHFIPFASIPVFIALLYFYIFPSVTGLLYAFPLALPGYIGQLFQAHYLWSLFTDNLWSNFRAIFENSWSFFNPGTASSPVLKICFSVQILVIASAMAYFVFIFFRQMMNRSLAFISYKPLLKALIVIAGGVLSHAFLMNITANHVWGPYWYGSYMGIFFVLLIAGIYRIQHSGLSRVISVLAVCAIFMSMLTFPYLNFAYKKLHFYPSSPTDIQKVFERKINRFEMSRTSVPQNIKESIQDIVRAHESPNTHHDAKIIRELLWLPIELGWFKNNIIQENVFNYDATHYLIKTEKILRHDNMDSADGHLGFYRKSIKNYNDAIRQNPDHLNYYNRGTCYSIIGQYLRAVEDFDQAIRLKPDFARAHHNRGVAYFYQMKYAPGCRDAQKACELGICTLLEDAKAKGYCR